jgi:hypothetical protein
VNTTIDHVRILARYGVPIDTGYGTLYVYTRPQASDPNTYCIVQTSDDGSFRVALVADLEAETLNRSFSVDVYGPRKEYGRATYTPATVNWSAIGSKPAADARTYATLLRLAAEVADASTEAAMAAAAGQPA